MGRRAHAFPGVFDLRGSGCDLRKRETEPFDSGVKACAELAEQCWQGSRAYTSDPETSLASALNV